MNDKQSKLDLGHELPAGHPDQLELALPEDHKKLPSESKKLLEETHEKVKDAIEYEGEGLA
jgi:hypothetical protein